MKTQFTIDNNLNVDYDTLIEMKNQLIASDFFGSRIKISRTPHSGVIVAQNILNLRVPLKTWNEKTLVWM